MGWLIALPMLIIGCIQGSDTLVITSAIFAVAGSLSVVATAIKNEKSKSENK